MGLRLERDTQLTSLLKPSEFATLGATGLAFSLPIPGDIVKPIVPFETSPMTEYAIFIEVGVYG